MTNEFNEESPIRDNKINDGFTDKIWNEEIKAEADKQAEMKHGNKHENNSAKEEQSWKKFFDRIANWSGKENGGRGDGGEKETEKQPGKEKNATSKVKRWFSFNRLGFIILVLILAGLSIILYYYFGREKIWRPHYAEAYTLVPDSISQSANILITLPPGTSKEGMENNITFNPEVKGKWIKNQASDKMEFDPDDKLKVGKHYSIMLKLSQGNMGKDFLADEDPKIISVFPRSDSEANEKSDITIIFNRPMVPLSSLDIMQEKEVPVEISPRTKGKFKWIGTRTLQFIPQTSLIASAHYTVKIKSDFISLDSLRVEGVEHKFTTRALRYVDIHEGATVYNEPLKISFNQPVDLDRTIEKITLENETAHKQIEFIAQYGKKEIFNKKTNKYEEEKDESILLISNKKDRFGRENFWDFNNNYRLNINQAFPKEGDILLEEAREVSIQVPDIIADISASSEKTNFATPKMFDPSGKLWIEFYEDIDLEKSKIRAQKMTGSGYGEKCKDEGEQSYYGDDVNCEKVTDRKKIYLTFDQGNIKNSEKLSINFDSVRNAGGIVINRDSIEKNIYVFPELKVLKTVPGNNFQKGSLTELIICGNTPIAAQPKEDIDKFLKADPVYEFKGWNPSLLIDGDNARYHKCGVGEFESQVNYGLMPDTNYKMEVKVTDEFSQEKNITLNFMTGEMPDRHLNFFHFQKGYSITTPDKTKLTYAAENMDYVEINICQLRPENMLYYLENKPMYWEGPETIKSCLNAVLKKIELPHRYWIKNYFKVDLSDYIKNPRGHFILTFSNPHYKEPYEPYRRVFERTYLSITNLGVVEKKVEVNSGGYFPESNLRDKDIAKLENLYWVTNINRLEAVPEARIDLFSNTSNSSSRTLNKEKTIYTDKEGIAKSTPVDKLRGVVVSVPNDSALLSDNTNKFEYTAESWLARKAYVYTDRPIYRPGDEVHIKGLYRVGYDGSYEILRGKVPLKVYDSQNKELFSRELEVSEYGTFNMDFIIDTKAPLGQYRIEGAKFGYAYFEVEEYVPAAFKVEARTDKEEYISKDTMNLDIDASYYFGAPVAGGEVEYSLASQNYYFDKYKGSDASFGSAWYYCYDCEYGDKFLLRNKVKLQENGKARISQILDIGDLFKKDEDKQSKIITLYITVTNKNGQAVSTQKSFIIHAGEYYLGANTDKSFLGKNERFVFKAKSVDTAGQSVAEENINMSINKVKWAMYKRKEVDGAFYYRWEKQLEKIEEKNFKTDDGGNWQDSFSLKNEGEYELILSGQDSRGNMIRTEEYIYVWGEGYVDIEPSNDNSLDVITDKSNLDVGNKAKIIIKSPYDRAKALVSIERGQVLDYKIVDVNQSLYEYNFDIKESYIPNIYASVVLVSGKPEVKFGKVAFNVNTKEKELSIDVKANKEFYLPGEEVVLDFSAKDAAGNPAKAEFSAAVVDMSVLALKGNPKKDPVKFFYDGFPLSVSTVSNVKDILYEVNVPTGTKGGGGGEPGDLAKKKRGVFKDTAFWQATLTTDADGKAQAKFKLPDNLTTWQVETLGITKDTKVGVAYKEFMARKDLMVVPLRPRFIIPGDEFYIGAQIFNQTQDEQKLTVALSSEKLAMKDDAEKKIKLKPGETETIYFKVISPSEPEEGWHKFTLCAKNEKYEDTVEQAIKIRRNDTYEATATANYTSEKQATEYIYIPPNVVDNKGELTINHSATLAVFISDALKYLLAYPYGCSEQIASRLEGIAMVKKGLRLKNLGDKFKIGDIEYEGESYPVDKVVEMGLERIYENQQSDGGFSYYAQGKSSAYLTLRILNAFKALKDAGYEVNGERLARAVQFIDQEIRYENTFQQDNEFVIAAAYSISNLNGKLGDIITERIRKMEGNEKYINEDIGNIALSYMAIVLSREEKIFGKKFKDKIFKILENRIEIDSRGSFLPTRGNVLWQYYETPVKNSALLLKALTQDKRDNQILDRILRWLLNSRKKDGAWGSTNNTVTVIDAMTDYLSWQRETESNFTLRVLIGDEEKSKFTYEPKTILEQNSFEVPIRELGLNSFNRVVFEKNNHNMLKNNLYYDMSLKYYLPIDSIAPRDEGFTIERNFYRLEDENFEDPVRKAKVGDVLRGHVEVMVPKARNFVAIEDFIPAGVELVNFNLATSDQTLQGSGQQEQETDFYGYPRYDETLLRPDFQEVRDDRLMTFVESLEPNTYHFDYYVRVLIPGKYHHLPAVASEMYTPENFGRTRGEYFEVDK